MGSAVFQRAVKRGRTSKFAATMAIASHNKLGRSLEIPPPCIVTVLQVAIMAAPGSQPFSDQSRHSV
jgi:hypothetical protein